MNRIFSVAALAAMVALAGCGKNEDTSASSTGTTSSPPAASPAPAPAPAPAAAPDTSAATPGGTAPAAGTGASGTAATAATGGATTVAAGGQDTYAKACVACHGAGVAGAPKLGDKADWGPRIAQGKDTLYTHAIQGFTGAKGMMPPKGGMTSLSDDEVKAAVDYMVAQAS
ncbi:MAG: c-type cytochrome [Ramlibacter sp.]